MTELKPAEIKALWTHFDKNRDGLITRDELEELIQLNLRKQLGADTHVPPELLEECFSLLDTNKGGSIDFDEFRVNMNKYWLNK